MTETKTLPIKVIATSIEGFSYLENIVKRLNPDFIKQFETIESTFSVKFTTPPLYGDRTIRMVGTITSIKEMGSVIEHDSKLKQINIFTDITIEGKKQRIMCEFYISEKAKYDIAVWTEGYEVIIK